MGHLFFYWVALMVGRGRARRELESVKIPAYQARLSRYQHVQYCKRCQMAWLDTAAAAVQLVDVESLLTG